MGTKTRTITFNTEKEAQEYKQKARGQRGYSEVYLTGPIERTSEEGVSVWTVDMVEYYG